MSQLIKKIMISFEIEAKTSLRIGDSKESSDIGGVDLPIVRTKLKGRQPYLPGSSIKGKIRSLLEQSRGCTVVGENSNINQLFGSIGKTPAPSRIIFRDAFLTEMSRELLAEADTDLPYTEVKFETAIDRVSGTAKPGSLRQIERVPAGAKFESHFIINVFDESEYQQHLDLLKEGIALLNYDYLGGHGSRGAGQVHFTISEPVQVYPVLND